MIGERCKHIAPEEADDYILGYTVANDYGLHDFRDTDAGSMLRVKGSDSLCPLGPGLVTDWDFRDKAIQTRVNGDVKQDGNTDEMIWDMRYLVADLARTITLLPNDVILSGTPANSRPGRARRRRGGRGRGPRDPPDLHRRRRRARSARTSALNPRSPKR